MPKIHRLRSEQVIDTSLELAWEFISAPGNLDAITPPELGFEILTELPDEMHEGLLIEYRIRIPWLGHQRWLTEIKHIREEHSFVDEQRIGPYKLWFHYHEVSPCADGVRFLDQVTYALPFGPAGALAHTAFVQRQLRTIFEFRSHALHEQLAAPESRRTATALEFE